MMLSRAVFGSFLLLCGVAGCQVGEDSGANRGSLGAACNPNGSCDDGLSCVAEVCTRPADGAPIGGDAAPGGIIDAGDIIDADLPDAEPPL